jgi:hypothetical protein
MLSMEVMESMGLAVTLTARIVLLLYV